MTWPLWRNDPAAARALGRGPIAVAVLIAWAAPFLPGATVGLLAPARWETLSGLGVVLVMVPVVSWIGLLPGGAIAYWLIRRGTGGFGAVSLAGLALGTLLGGLLGGGVSFAVAGALLSGLVWLSLRMLAPDTLRREHSG